MEVIIPSVHKKAVHPWAIFTQSVLLWKNNLLKITLLNAGIMLPGWLLSTWGQSMQNAVSAGAAVFTPLLVAVILAGTAFSVWSSTVISTVIWGLQKENGGFNAASGIKSSWKYFVRILIATVMMVLVVAGIALGGTAVSVVAAILLAKINNVAGIATFVLLFFFTLIFAIYFFIRWGLAGLACIIEDLGSFAALRRSRLLVSGHVNPYVGTMALVVIFMFILMLPLMFAQSFLASARLFWAILLLNYAVSAVLGPSVTFVMVKLYTNLKEAVDNVHAQ